MNIKAILKNMIIFLHLQKKSAQTPAVPEDFEMAHHWSVKLISRLHDAISIEAQIGWYRI